jgi:dCTP deaminase
MSDAAALFPLGRERLMSTGVLPSQGLRTAIATHEIHAVRPIGPEQIQPASLDLRLGDKAYRVLASFLPGRDATVAEKLERLTLHSFSLADGAVLEKNCVYIVPLQEHLRLKRRTTGHANPKSSIGRLDIFARVISDRCMQFDKIEDGYEGPLYVEISPRTFSVRVRTGSRLVQVRLRRGSPLTSWTQQRRLQEEVEVINGPAEPEPGGLGLPLADAPEGAEARPRRYASPTELMGQGLAFTVDVQGTGPGSVIGYKARKHCPLIDVDAVGRYEVLDFWEPVLSRNGRGLILDPEDFYILASRESVSVPADHAAEMLAYDTLMGEFRVHYAGFFDPGFGAGETGGAGTRAVLEVRSHEVPFLVENGQIVGRLVYERLTEPPDILYGGAVGSYQGQGLALAKHFKPPH